MLMQAAVLRKLNSNLSIEMLEIPEVGDGQILVKMHYSGICGSQVKEIFGERGHDKWLPHLLGHEGVGTVEKIGPRVSKVAVNDLVGISWLDSNGLDAEGCRYKSKTFGDFVNSGKVTTFSQYTIVPEKKVFTIPNNITELEAVLFGCAIPTGAGMVLNQATPCSIDKVLVVGLGGIGFSALTALKLTTCEDISVADTSTKKLELAEALGVKKLFHIKNNRRLTEIIEEKYSIIFEATGTVSGIEQSFDLLYDDGQLLFASHPKSGEKISIDPHDLIKGKRIYGSWGGQSTPDSTIQEFSKFKEGGQVDLSTFLDAMYPFDSINIAINDLRENKVLRPIIKF